MSTRTRTITWHDPAEAAAFAGRLTGLEFLHRISSGLIPPPPVAELVGFEPIYVMPGRVVFEYEPREEHYNPLGSVHGGILTTVLDTVMGCAVQSLLDEGVGYATIELKTSFVRPVKIATGVLRAEGVVVHGGSRVSTAEGKLVDGAGTLYAHATSSALIVTHELRKEAPLAA
ncbi:MAG: PaaI family thioesterase [Actinomycetota bacterium]|nr:PaaI family thioesterase [Actinomycetota bacterium]